MTEPYLNVRAIKQVATRVWLLTKTDQLSPPTGPAYVDDEYLSRPLPSGKSHISDVIEAAGRTWLLGMPGLYLFDGQRAIEIGPVPEDVVGLREEDGHLIAKTETRNWPFTSGGPDYVIDVNRLEARPLKQNAGH